MMRVLLLLAVFAVAAVAADIDATWKAMAKSPNGPIESTSVCGKVRSTIACGADRSALRPKLECR
jgi:hypothetical protein